MPNKIIIRIPKHKKAVHKNNMQEINDRIQREICRDTCAALLDSNLMDEYSECKSVKQSITILSDILKEFNDEETINKIIDKFMIRLIPAGTKGVIRGNKFNSIVKKYIIGLQLDPNVFDVQFEQTCAEYITAEIPDWYIRQKTTNAIIIGMNQLDLWGGGQQFNRGDKYLMNSDNTERRKLVCVVCNDIKHSRTTNKAYRLFETGFRENTLCYLGNLKHIIHAHFDIAEESG